MGVRDVKSNFVCKIVERAESTFVDEMLVWDKSSAGLSRTFHV